MSDKPPLTDDEIYDRLHDAFLALGPDAGETVRGDTALKAARRSIILLQMSLVKAQEENSDKLAAIIDQKPS